MVQPLWIPVWQFLKKLTIELAHDPAIPVLGIYTKERMIVIHKITVIQTNTASQFTTARVETT